MKCQSLQSYYNVISVWAFADRALANKTNQFFRMLIPGSGHHRSSSTNNTISYAAFTTGKPQVFNSRWNVFQLIGVLAIEVHLFHITRSTEYCFSPSQTVAVRRIRNGRKNNAGNLFVVLNC